mmetsp:Transcript_4458/g.6542  ORF Transcript_4458/g.6542 Transcript_4458/m.6542 type:complete len:264 (+) Transcript_4458:762-1553(+)
MYASSVPVASFQGDNGSRGYQNNNDLLGDLLIDEDNFKKVFIIGVCGGSASGKTTVCKEIIKKLKGKSVEILSQDSFYKSLTPEQKEMAKQSQYDFDHPNAFDYDIFVKTLKKLKNGGIATVPVYDFKTHSRLEKKKETKGADVIIVEGILIFYSQELLKLMDMKIFVDTDDDVRLTRRIRRDIAERGREVIGVLDQWERFVKPNFDQYILPTKREADVIIPRGGDNIIAIELITKHITLRLYAKSGKGDKKMSKTLSSLNLN